LTEEGTEIVESEKQNANAESSIHESLESDSNATAESE
jgi:hypothetical protein